MNKRNDRKAEQHKTGARYIMKHATATGRTLGGWTGRRGFGLNEVIGIAAGIIIAAVIVIPGLQAFATDLISSLDTWWTTMASSIFATS